MKPNIGKCGEDIATKYLLHKGYKIIERNYRIRNGEIDIIAIDNKEKALVFVEVKTRSSDEFGSPFDAIHFHKLKALLNAALVYKQKKPHLPELLRIDAIAVILDHKEAIKTIEHRTNVSSF